MPEPPEQEIEVFNLALELPAGDRAAYLDKACAGDVALRQRVEELLQASEAACAVLEGSAAVPTEKPGDRIGRYKLLQQIGEGGCGVVYMAEQEEPVRRKVALKVIKLGMDTKSVIARFEAERQALALMDHPNIAKVLDAGATEAGRPYFVMELVRGVKITEYCDANKLSTAARLALFIQVCQAIQHAHQKGIIHRDIKPSNILVADNDGAPVPKIIDFGIAKATTDQRLTDKTVFTAFEQFIGTPAYMSPEQAKLTGLDIDTRSDIYSLGVLLYELLTGKTPFESKRLLDAGLDEVRRIIREEEPARPSTKLETLDASEQTTVAGHRQSDPPKLAHLIRGDLDWIVMKALEKDRTRRYETANGFAADVQRHLSNEPVTARPPSQMYRFQKMARRNRAAIIFAALIVVVLVAATCISAWQAVRATRANKLAAARLVDSENARKDSESISKFLTEVFQSPDPARDGRTITVAETLSNATKKLDTDLAGQPARRAKLQSAISESFHALGLYREALPLQEKVRDYYLAVSGSENVDTLVATRRVGALYDAVGRRDEARNLLEQTLALSRKALGSEHPETINTMTILGTACDGSGHREEALKLREEALALSRKVNGPENAVTMGAIEQLASSYEEAGRLPEAISLGEQDLTLSVKVLGPEHPETINAMINLASSYYTAGRRDEALKMWEKALPLGEKVYGPEHPMTLATMFNLATIYDDVGRQEEALKLREQALAVHRRISGPAHPDTLVAMQGLAISYAKAGRLDEAIKLLEEAVELSRKGNGAEHPSTLSAMGTLSVVYYQTGRRDEAVKLAEEVLALKRKVMGPNDHETLNAMRNLALFYDTPERRDESIKLQEQALEICLKTLGPKHPDTLQVMSGLITTYYDAGRPDEVLKILEQALTFDRKALGSQDPATLQAMNDLAWLQATSETAEIRNGANAVLLGEEAVAATHRQNPGFLDTLAAAYAQSQQFEKAAAAEQEGMGLLKTEEEKQDYASRLKLYQARQPCRVKPNL